MAWGTFAWGEEAWGTVQITGSAVVVAEDAIKIIFTDNVAATDTYHDVSNYSITNLTSSHSPNIVSVYPASGSVDHVILEIRGLQPSNEYLLTIQNLYDVQGGPLLEVTARWTMRRTKLDYALKGMGAKHNMRKGSNIRGLLEAIMIADEDIGGDF